MKRSPNMGEVKDAFFRKLVQLEMLVEKFNSALHDLMYQKEYLGICQESQMQKLHEEFVSKRCVLLEELESKERDASAIYKKKYRRNLNLLSDDLRKNFAAKQSQIENVTNELSESLNEIVLTSKQLKHSVETAGNALNAQIRITVRDIEKTTAVSKETFAANIQEYSAQFTDKLAKFETEHQQRLRDIEKQGNAAITRAKKTEKRKPKVDLSRYKTTAGNLRSSVEPLKTSVKSILESGLRQLREARDEMRKTCEMMNKTSHVDPASAIQKLEDELTRKIEEIKRKNSQTIKEKRVKVDNLELVLDMDKREHARKCESKKQQLSEVLEAVNNEIAEFEREKTKQMDELVREKDLAKEVITDELSKQIDKINQIRNAHEHEKRELIDKARRERDEMISELKSLYDNEKRQVDEAHARELADKRSEFASQTEKLQEQIASKRNELQICQSVLEEVESVSITDEDNIFIDTSDIETLQTDQDKEYNKLSEKKMNELAKLGKRMDIEIATLRKNLDTKDQLEMAKVREELEHAYTEEYDALDKEYHKQYESEESKLSEIPHINPKGDELLSKANRLVETLTHQSYQLKSTIKFQRTSLESEWKAKIDAENARHDDLSIEFAKEHQSLQQLFDLKNDVAEQRYKNQQELSMMKNELSALELQNQEIWMLFENKKTEAMKQEQYDQWMQILASATDEGTTVISEAMSEREAERSSLKELIEEYQRQTKEEMDSMKRFIDRSGVEVNEFGMRLRQSLDVFMRDVKQEAQNEVRRHKESLNELKYNFEIAFHDLETKVKTSTKQKKELEAQLFSEYNNKRSTDNMRLEDLSRSNRAVLDELKSKRRAVIDFFNEKIGVIIKARNLIHDSYINRGPRPIEQDRIQALEKQLRDVSKSLATATSEFTSVKKMIKVRERVYNHNFGKKPKIGTLGLSSRHSYT